MNKKSIIIIGGGDLQIPAILEAKKLGLRTAVMDKNPNAKGVFVGDDFIESDISDVELSLDVAKIYAKTHDVAGVITVGTDFSRTSAMIAECLGLPGIGFSTAERATDKIKMRNAFKDGGISQPSFYPLFSEKDLDAVDDYLSYPMVIKPADSMGARGVKKIANSKELKDAFKDAFNFSNSGRVICEEYIDADELSLDALIWNGEIFVRGIADRIIEYPPYFVETGHVMPSRLSAEKIKDAVDIFKKGIVALGIENGAAKGDIRVNEKGSFVGEIAARLSGGFMSGFTYPYSSGVNLIASAINIAIGKGPLDLTPTKDHCSIEKAIIVSPGKIKSIKGIDDAKSIDGVKNIFLRYTVGQNVLSPKNNMEKGGNIIVEGYSYDNAIAILEKVFNTIKIEVI